MPVIDVQVHPFDRNHPGRPWASPSHGLDSATGDEMVAAMKSVGVDGAIMVSSFSAYEYDPSYALEVYNAYPDKFRVVTPVDATDPAIDDVVAKWAAMPGARGIRIRMRDGLPMDADHPGLHRAFAAAAKHGLPVNLLCWGILDKGLPHIRQHPDTVIVIDHLGLLQPACPPVPADVWADLPKLLALAQYDNVRVKISGACTMSHQPFPYDDIWEPEFLQRLSDALQNDPQAGIAFCDHGVMRGGGEHDERLSVEQSARFGRTALPGGPLSGKALQEAVLGKSVAASSFMLARRFALDIPLIESGGEMWDLALGVGACRASGRAEFVPERLGWYRVSETMLSATWTDPRKQIELARPTITILMVMLLSRQYAEVRGPALGRLLVAIRHALAASARTRSLASVGRVTTRILAGVRDARRLTPSRPAPAL